MIAYNRERLLNCFYQKEAEIFQQAGLLSQCTAAKLDMSLPAYQTQTHAWARMGLFVLGCFSFATVFGVFMMPFEVILEKTFGVSETDMIPLLLGALIGYLSTEWFIWDKKYFAQGLDDAFLFCGQCSLLGFIATHSLKGDHYSFFFSMMFLIGIISCIRYVDALSALIASFGLTAFVFVQMLDLGEMGKLILPFALMLTAAVLYLTTLILKKKYQEKIYFHFSLKCVYGFSLLLFYLSGNYLVVREGTVTLMNAVIDARHDIPFAWIFYAFTFLIPLGYIYLALHKHDRLLLWIGLATLAFGIYSYHHYYTLLPTEWMLCLVGLILFSITFFTIRALKEKTGGITFVEDPLESNKALLQIQALATVATNAVQPATSQQGTEFGGGSFGGGGAEGKF